MQLTGAMTQLVVAALVFTMMPGSLGDTAFRESKIAPELEPVSDHKFMKHDYPDDKRAPVFHKFSHPYPEVQDDDHYDNDFVADKNSDNGQWAAQMGYDTLKSKLMAHKESLGAALAKMQEEARELDEARAAEQKMEDKAKAAAVAEDHADHLHDKAQDHEARIKDDIEKASAKVEKEVADLENCKKQLSAARDHLKALLQEKADAEEARKEGHANENAAEEVEQTAELSEAELERKVEEERKEYEAAKAAYEKELADMKAAEDLLDEKALKLQAFRKADPDGGVYTKASAPAALPSLLAGLIASSLLLI